MLDIRLGFKIRDIRNSKRITLQELANVTKLTTSFISQMERGIVSPSIDSLRKIAQALGVSVGGFFEEDLKEFTFIRKDKAPKVIDKETKSSYETLVSDLLGVKMKPLMIRLQKGGEIKKELLLEEGDAFVKVMGGNIEIVCDKEKFVLNKGDSLYCKGQKRPQKIINSGDKETVLLWVKSNR
ncbi:MAG: XRE family transcriptional regulator [Candidatus Omnitrophica bacterium]|nr:XRE family transcriptional regulator [Candidatus Omnitrophota bacterium]